MGCLIVLSATLPPSQIDNIEPRLISRFEWGILLNILPPNKNQLFEIAKTWAKKLKLNFDPKIISYLTNTFDNASSISKALQAIALHSHLTNNEKINDIALIENAIKNLKELNNKKEITANEIIKIISSYFGIRTEDILSKSQSRECSTPRQFAMFFCRTKLKLSYTKVAKIFNRDHSTIMAGVKQITKGINSKDRNIFSKFLKIFKKLCNYSAKS